MVAAVTRTPFDRFGKQMVRDALEGRYSVETDAEVPADTRRIDLWVTPRDACASPPDHLGLLGRITNGSVTLEFFHNTPSGEELHVCLIKHGEFRHNTEPSIMSSMASKIGAHRRGCERWFVSRSGLSAAPSGSEAQSLGCSATWSRASGGGAGDGRDHEVREHHPLDGGAPPCLSREATSLDNAGFGRCDA